MDRMKRFRPSPAMIVAIIALVLSLGGTSYAAIVLPANSVGNKQIKKNAVTGAKVKNGSLTTSDIKASSLSKLGRVAIKSNASPVSVAASASARITIVTLKAPTKGFVLVNGWVTAAYPNARWGVRVWDDGGGADAHSPWINAVIGTGGESIGLQHGGLPGRGWHAQLLAAGRGKRGFEFLQRLGNHHRAVHPLQRSRHQDGPVRTAYPPCSQPAVLTRSDAA